MKYYTIKFNRFKEIKEFECEENENEYCPDYYDGIITNIYSSNDSEISLIPKNEEDYNNFHGIIIFTESGIDNKYEDTTLEFIKFHEIEASDDGSFTIVAWFDGSEKDSDETISEETFCRIVKNNSKFLYY